MEDVLILLGSNLGDRSLVINKACKSIDTLGCILKYSKIYETDAWGKTDVPPYLNQVVLLQTALSPHNLLLNLLRIEKELGRERFEKWGSRIIDLDILYYADQCIEEEFLKIPHPEIHNRRFTLIPLVDIAAEWEHPIFKKSQKGLLEECKDSLTVRVFSEKINNQ